MKKLVIIILIIISAFVFASCGNDVESPTKNPGTTVNTGDTDGGERRRWR